MELIKFFLLIIFINIFISCSEQTIYSGKIINQENLENIKISNKNELISRFGNPSFIDPIQNKVFYYTEKVKENSFYIKKTEYSYLFVFTLDKNENIISQKAYNLQNKNEISLAKDETSNDIIKRGLIEKIFGGVGPQQMTTTP
tara:strand:+ start:453 stop:884 length:432 start_codon:yes stop_codon:yes gene_type:complete